MESGENTKVSLHHLVARRRTIYRQLWGVNLLQHMTDVCIVDYILFIKADVDLNVNPNEVRDSRFVSQEDLRAMFKDESLKFTPWFKLICESMLYEWWDHLDSGLEKYMGEREIRRM
jgi:isopentenyldiphosphate isomerase